MNHRFKELTDEDREFYNGVVFEDYYYRCSECGLLVYDESDGLGRMVISELNGRDLPKRPEEISCEEIIIREIIE